MYEITYICPHCNFEWVEEYECACDSECPHCDLESIQAYEFVEIESD